MVVDTSALVAIILGEDDADTCKSKLLAAPKVVIPAPTLFETSMVLCYKLGPSAVQTLEHLLAASGATIAAFSQVHAEVAYDCFQRYGKGRHRAALNFADCFVYAFAKLNDEALLFVGSDFSQTDITVA